MTTGEIDAELALADRVEIGGTVATRVADNARIPYVHIVLSCK